MNIIDITKIFNIHVYYQGNVKYDYQFIVSNLKFYERN